jgi:hypothetical protein
MKLRFRHWVAGTFCALTAAVTAPAAHAQEYQLKAAFRAGQVLQAQLQEGNEQTARQVIGLFVNAIHGYFENAAGEPAWIVWTADLKQSLVATDQFSKLESLDGFAFSGVSTEGPLVGSKITGAVIQDTDEKLYVVTQVDTQAVRVLFSQPLEPIDLSESTGTSN